VKVFLSALSNHAVTSRAKDEPTAKADADVPAGRERVEPCIDSATLFARHAPFVVSFLHRQGARGADLDDLVQEVFLRAHRKGGYRPGVASPTTFLAQLALQANLKRRRTAVRAQRDDHAASDALHGQAPHAPDESLLLSEARALLQESLLRMDHDQRAVFILFELEQESCASIAAGLEIPVGTVHSRLHAARKTFRAIVARRARGGGASTQPSQQTAPSESEPERGQP
jgi:RNA polymerase sigma-70 factor (ECF subfamily)